MSGKCKVCGFDKHVENADFCQYCGVILTNYCTNGNCDLNNGDSVPIDPEARYCPYCGSQSTFMEAGYFDDK